MSRLQKWCDDASMELPASEILYRIWENREMNEPWIEHIIDNLHRGFWEDVKRTVLADIIRNMAEKIQYLDGYYHEVIMDTNSKVFFQVEASRTCLIVKYKDTEGKYQVYKHLE